MNRMLLLTVLAAGAAVRVLAQPLPAEVARFYEDWNRLVFDTTLDERRELWDNPRLPRSRDEMGRIRRQWRGLDPRMPMQGYDGFPVWSYRLEVHSVTWTTPDTLTVSVWAWPTALVTPAQGDPAAGTRLHGGGARLGLTHIWHKGRGGWTVEQSLAVMI